MPVDENGMPRALYPDKQPNPLDTDIFNMEEDHAFYTRQDPAYTDPAGEMLRRTRTSMVEGALHYTKHWLYADGIAVTPRTEDDKVLLGLLSLAGYLDPDAIDIRDPENPTVTRMPDHIYKYVRGRQQLGLEQDRDALPGVVTHNHAEKKIGGFFVVYAVQNGLADVDNRLKGRFMKASCNDRLLAGRQVLVEATRLALRPFESKFQEVYDQGLVRPDHTTPEAVVTPYYDPKYLPKYFALLKKVLNQAA